jgi:hypothetical protein
MPRNNPLDKQNQGDSNAPATSRLSNSGGQGNTAQSPGCDQKPRSRIFALIDVNAPQGAAALFPNVTGCKDCNANILFRFVRDRRGLEFHTPFAAIEHSKDLARQLRAARRTEDPELMISVLDQSGAEVIASRSIRSRPPHWSKVYRNCRPT